MDWADEHYLMSNYDDFNQWFDALSQDFNQEGRLPLEEIFDEKDMRAAEDLFNDTHKEIPEFEVTEPEDITEPEVQPITESHIVEDIISEFVKPSDIIPNIKFAAKFGGFLRKLFRL